MGSKSESKSTSTTQNVDARVVGEQDSIVVNAGSSLQVVDEFPEDVQNLVFDILNFAGDVGRTAVDSVNKANDALGERLIQTETGNQGNYMLYVLIFVAVIVAMLVFNK